jgi:hypothetical protein
VNIFVQDEDVGPFFGAHGQVIGNDVASHSKHLHQIRHEIVTAFFLFQIVSLFRL